MKKKEISIADITNGDRVLGVDGKYYEIQHIFPVHLPKNMYRVEFSNGSVECSGDHQWIFYKNTDVGWTVETNYMFSNPEEFEGWSCGKKNGPALLSVTEIEPKKARCIETNAPYHLFEILTDRHQPIFTSNCQFRAACGRLGSIPSMMLMGTTVATTISGKRPGAGMIVANGIVDNIQFYFEEASWLWNWFKKRGLNNKGYSDERKEEESIDFSDLEEDEEISFEQEITSIEFAGVKGEVNKTMDQKFKEV